MRKEKAKHARALPVTGVDWSQTYPVGVTDETGSPRYNPGDTVHVHPSLPVKGGDWVLIVQKAPARGAAPVTIIAKLVARDSRVVILHRLNPAGVFRIDAVNILSIHRIVGSSEGET